MSGFLDRLAARAVGAAPSLLPRVRTRFEPGTGVLAGEPRAQVEEEGVEAPPRVEAQSPAVAVRTFEPAPPRRSAPPPASPRPAPRSVVPKQEAARPARPEAAPAEPAPFPPRARRREEGWAESPPALRPSAPPAGLGDDEDDEAAAGAGTLARDRGTKSSGKPRPAGPHASVRAEGEPAAPAPARLRRAALTGLIEPAEPAAPAEEPRALSPLPRRTRADDLPTVEPDRHAPLPPSLLVSSAVDDGPSETVIRVSIGRIDVRTPPPPAPEARPARSAGPRLSLAEYLERREGRRR